MTLRRVLPFAILVLSFFTIPASAQTDAGDGHGWFGTETVKTRYGDFEFRNGYPASDTARRLQELLLLNRAVEVYMTHYAAVSMFQFRKGLADFGARQAHEVVIFETLMDAETLLLTANSETVYVLGFLDLKRDGPTVIEAPPQMLGLLDDMWMRYITDVGPAGPDKGQGGKFLFLPPGYAGAVPEGYFVFRPPTYGVWMLLRAVDPKPEAATARSKQLRIYPLAQADKPPAMRFINGSGQAIDTIAPDDYRYFEQLGQVVQEEPAAAVTSLERFYLAAIGMQAGKPFAPDEKTQALLSEAARIGQAMARMNSYASTDPNATVYPDRRWQWAFVGGSYTWDTQGYINPDRRSGFAYAATGNTPAMASQVVGAGSQYFWTPRDASGAYLDGARSYRLRLPPNIPVKDFWSVTVYDTASRSMLQNGMKFPTVSQYTDPEINADGSVDIYFGPKAPQGKEKNWIKTVEGRGWFPILRFYGPLPPFFDKSWKPDDIIEVN